MYHHKVVDCGHGVPAVQRNERSEQSWFPNRASNVPNSTTRIPTTVGHDDGSPPWSIPRSDNVSSPFILKWRQKGIGAADENNLFGTSTWNKGKKTLDQACWDTWDWGNDEGKGGLTAQLWSSIFYLSFCLEWASIDGYSLIEICFDLWSQNV